MQATCTISDEVKTAFKKFQGGGAKDKPNAVFKMKIDTKKQEVQLEDVSEGNLEDLAADLPEFAPRFLAYNYKWLHDDGRISYPLMFIFYCPEGISTQLNMLYSSTKTILVNELKFSKVFEVRDPEELTAKWVKDKLAFFK
eukprot:TRINITY_DN2437_c0_g1_i1.p1 TRINITY_DN2437_c0_g1~~TRINITY_DN2437_c0_g1_i1.p1  ORF type:complete len:141 (-),score=32.16 TRINITY_DN2437_c0_g1_i1:113-535(-)